MQKGTKEKLIQFQHILNETLARFYLKNILFILDFKHFNWRFVKESFWQRNECENKEEQTKQTHTHTYIESIWNVFYCENMANYFFSFVKEKFSKILFDFFSFARKDEVPSFSSNDMWDLAISKSLVLV